MTAFRKLLFVDGVASAFKQCKDVHLASGLTKRFQHLICGSIGIGLSYGYLQANPTWTEKSSDPTRLTGHYKSLSAAAPPLVEKVEAAKYPTATHAEHVVPKSELSREQILIEKLELIPHPEGGFFRETYRSGATPMKSCGQTDPSGALMPTEREHGERNVFTSIYWMLNKESPNGWWCSNMSDHVHYYHAGAGITYYVVHPDGTFETQRLGPNVEDGDVLQFEVKGGALKACHIGDADFTLIGEAVGPGFDFRDFRWVTEAELESKLSSVDFTKVAKLVKPDQRRDFGKYYDANKKQ
mmetsp:Transcript_15556/g.21490  ORF Transcript_15556/g.21490 Transcript_15556/m.21490 type:complete len:298 (+) Transcript_15556:114-1007(+)|eukprot:CAMPEP_0196582684 /NCGR_PEP_ID=MMETSP1081-20130531/40114_1 /TAXON_ID=36882 /ORGANISM="Pyramimonas amylifera, Strain CCMP720" /LENGTH=297 /DNA_ID=CAMNT_0041903323 /DNA_START=98 /DNA_END=991 /DNA_ORIENTATION=+